MNMQRQRGGGCVPSIHHDDWMRYQLYRSDTIRNQREAHQMTPVSLATREKHIKNQKIDLKKYIFSDVVV